MGKPETTACWYQPYRGPDKGKWLPGLFHKWGDEACDTEGQGTYTVGIVEDERKHCIVVVPPERVHFGSNPEAKTDAAPLDVEFEARSPEPPLPPGTDPNFDAALAALHAPPLAPDEELQWYAALVDGAPVFRADSQVYHDEGGLLRYTIRLRANKNGWVAYFDGARLHTGPLPACIEACIDAEREARARRSKT
jgi:hypothetical protein